MKGLATSIALIILLVILLSVLIPFFLIVFNTPYYSSQGQIAAQAYQQQKELELNNVEKGNPILYYSSGTSPYLEVKFQTVGPTLNITQIYYYNGQWVPVLRKPVVVYGYPNEQTLIPLPASAFNKPILIVTGLSNMFFLNPNTSITTSTVIGPTGKVPVYVVSFAYNKTSNTYNIISVSAPVQFGSTIYNTPFIIYVNPATYIVSAKEVQIYLSQYGLTGKFWKWTVAGYGTLSAPDSPSTSVTVTGPTVLTLIYNVSLKKFKVQIVFSLTNGQPIPIGSTTTDPNTGATLNNVNTSMTVYVDNKPYQINAQNYVLNLCLTYGYHFIKYPTNFYLIFNYTYGNFKVPYGEKIEYDLYSIYSNTPKIQICNDYEIFVNSSGTVYIEFNPTEYYYLVLVKNDFYLPSGVTLVSNTSPVLGDINGQVLQVNVYLPGSTCPETIVLGPTEPYTYEELYLPYNTELVESIFYLGSIGGPGQSYTFNINGQLYTYNSLVACPEGYTVQNYMGLSYSPGSFYVVSPLIITIYEEWEYGGSPNG